MKSSKPYLISAIYEWIVDNDSTPHVLVKTDYPGVIVPDGFANDGQIVLNISMSAVSHFVMDKKVLSFNARFKGSEQSVYVPMGAIVGIYARENGQGMMFEADPVSVEQEPTKLPEVKGKPFLKIVK